MKIQHLDELYISQPMSEQERFQLLKSFQEHSYLEGIDKGTVLERDTILRLQNMKRQSVRRKYLSLIDRLNDYVHIGVRRHKRLKYKGRYNKKTSVSGTTVFNLPPWLQ